MGNSIQILKFVKIGAYFTEKNSPINIECCDYYYVDSHSLWQKCENPQILETCPKCHLDNGKAKCDKGYLSFICSYIQKLGSCKSCSYKNGNYVCDKCEESEFKYISEDKSCRTFKYIRERGYFMVYSDDSKSPYQL